MTITLTGGKYAAATLSAAATSTVTVGSAIFVSGDFAPTTPRVVGLWNSSATTFKGMAYVRRFVNTTQLQLEGPFYDPRTGAEVAQAVGDTLLVSKNYAECVQAGLTVSGNLVNLTDEVTYGTANVSASVCFYDQGKAVTTTSDLSGTLHKFAGGLVVFGRLLEYSSQSVSDGCAFYLANTIQLVCFMGLDSSAANVVIYGGSCDAQTTPAYFSPAWTGSSHGGTHKNVAANMCVVTRMKFGIDAVSPTSGGNWPSNASSHILRQCVFSQTGLNAILVRWGNGVVEGGFLSIPNFTNQPLSIFGSDAYNFTANIGAEAGKRLIVKDMGDSNSLVRISGSDRIQTWNFVNVISTDFRLSFGTATNLSSATNASGTLRFTDRYDNVQAASAIAMIRNSDWQVDGSVSSATGSDSVSVLHRTFVGHTTTNTYGPWTARIRKYGFSPLQSTVAESDYSLGTAGVAKNVSFGGSVNQVLDANVTLSSAAAQAITGVTVTDHGASPVTWQAKQWGITVTGNRTLNPSLTVDQLWHHLMWGISQIPAFNGKAGILWHILLNRSGSDYTTSRALYAAVQKGVRVVDESGNPFPGVSSMQADDGTTYTPPLSVVFTVGNLVSGSRVLIRRTDTQAVLANVSAPSATYAYSYQYAGSGIPVEVVVRNSSGSPSYLEWRTTATLGAVDSSVNANQVQE